MQKLKNIIKQINNQLFSFLYHPHLQINGYSGMVQDTLDPSVTILTFFDFEYFEYLYNLSEYSNIHYY